LLITLSLIYIFHHFFRKTKTWKKKAKGERPLFWSWTLSKITFILNIELDKKKIGKKQLRFGTRRGA